MENIDEKLKKIFVNVFAEENLDFSREISPRTVESWDSLKFINIIMSIEEEFDLTLSEFEIQNLKSFQDAINILGSK